MRASRVLIVVALAVPALVPPVAAGFSEGVTQWTFRAQRPRQSHPATVELFAVAPADMPTAVLCAVYTNDLPKANRGRVETVITVRRANGNQGSFRELTTVAANAAMPPCVNLANGLARGDMVSFEFNMSRFQKLKRKRADTFTALGAIYADQAGAQRGLTARLTQ